MKKGTKILIGVFIAVFICIAMGMAIQKSNEDYEAKRNAALGMSEEQAETLEKTKEANERYHEYTKYCGTNSQSRKCQDYLERRNITEAIEDALDDED